jgi:peptidoglycan/LPS O-acetylase OafA/YrhL
VSTGPAAGSGVPDALAPPPRNPRFPLLDGMRAVAVLCVVLVHTALFGGALGTSVGGRVLAHLNVGVSVFFLISGFLLYRPFIAHRGGGPAPPSVATYFKRRILRIYPAYWLILIVLLVVPGLPSVHYQHVWPMFAILHTLPIYGGPVCSAQVTQCGLAQTWSLVAEVTFYLALPFYALLVDRLSRRLRAGIRARAELVVLAVLSVVSLLLKYVLLSPAPLWFGWTVPGNVLWFALGMGMAVVSVAVGRSRVAEWSARTGEGLAVASWLAAGVLYVALSLWIPPTPFLLSRGQFFAVEVVFGAVALLLLAPMIFLEEVRGLPQRLAGARPVARLGLISYGIFLWHYPVVLKLHDRWHPSFPVTLIATAAIATACAAVSYYVLERPVLRLKYRSLLGSRAAGTRPSGS